MKAVHYSAGLIIPVLVVYRNQLAFIFCHHYNLFIKSLPYSRTEDPIRYNIGDNKRDAVCLNFKYVDCFLNFSGVINSLCRMSAS